MKDFVRFSSFNVTLETDVIIIKAFLARALSKIIIFERDSLF